MNKSMLCLSISALLAAGPMLSHAQAPAKLLRNPAVSEKNIAFMYAGDIWIANRDGSSPTRLTVNPAFEQDPWFSPDGKWIAFTGNYDGNSDVYVVPVEGGDPRRVTFHPARDLVRGWVDNDHVLFASAAESTNGGRTTQLFSVSVKGGLPVVHAKIPEATQGAVSPDGKFTAYIKNPDPTEGAGVFRPFKRYRGGYTPEIWIFNNASYQVEKIPAANSNNIRPVWVGKSVYFLSDRNHTMNIFRYDTDSKQVTQITKYKEGDDVKTLTSDGKTLAFEQGYTVHLLNPATSAVSDLDITIRADIPYKRPHYETIRNFERVNISPTGVRILVQGRGEIFSIPKEKGDVRNISNSPGTHERDPAWSPDGKWISYVSDKDGNYKLILRDQKAEKTPVEIELGKTAYYFTPTWSPDSKKLFFSDAHYNLFYVDVDSKKVTFVDKNANASIPPGGGNPLNAAWSPDSKWLLYTKDGLNEYGSVYVYSLATAQSTPVTDGMSNAVDATFSADGKYIFLAASTNSGMAISGLHMHTYERRPNMNLYAVLLSKTTPTLFTPESDEEPVKGDDKKKDTSKPKADSKDVKIDLDGLQDRIIALNLPADDYRGLNGSVSGKLFYMVNDEVRYYDLKDRKAEVFSKAGNYIISADGKKILLAAQGGYQVVDAGRKPSSPAEGKVDVSKVSMYVDPAAEWKQIFNEVYKIEGDYFYVKNMHGVDWDANRKRYAALLPYVSNRADLNYLLNEMMSEMVVGHNYVGNGDIPVGPSVAGGMLGADYEISNGKYRIKKIYTTQSWNPELKAPLAEAGLDVKAGEYILAVNGRPLTDDISIYSLLENQVGRQVTLLVNSSASESGAREVIVQPININGEMELRKLDWIEGNRKKVDELSGGKIAYVYMLNTGQEGYTFFNRYYFAQAGKQALLLDERFNGGGSVADYVIDILDRKVLSYWGVRDGRSFSTPGNGIYGPKAMLINEYAGSGGDMMPWMFNQKQLGKLVGKRTMGILVGISGYPSLIDGGYVTSPSFGIYDTKGNWVIENYGTPADIDVEQTPADVIAGRDPQLERGVKELLDDLKKNPYQQPTPKPADPVRVK